MPYITEEERAFIISDSNHIDIDKIECAGDLNFAVTYILDYYLHKKGLNYANLNELVGALECSKLEMYRRIASPYEDAKRDSNGDVYTQVI